MVKGRGGMNSGLVTADITPFLPPHKCKCIACLHFASGVNHIFFFFFLVSTDLLDLSSVFEPVILEILHPAPLIKSPLSHSKARLLPLTIIPKQERSTFGFPHLSLPISTTA